MQLNKPHIQKGLAYGFMLCCHDAKTYNDLLTRDLVFHFVFDPENYAVDVAGGKEIDRKTRRSERWGQTNPFHSCFWQCWGLGCMVCFVPDPKLLVPNYLCSTPAGGRASYSLGGIWEASFQKVMV